MNKSRTSKKNKKLIYKRLILKISGEILGAKDGLFDVKAIDYIVKQITTIHKLGAKIGIVVGGGNIIRGRDIQWFDKVNADVCGMMATIINGVMLYSHLHKHKIAVKLSSGIAVSGVVERCNRFEDLKFYESGGVLIFVGGTGNPLFTTDTAAALRAVEFNADVLIKGTKVEGVFSADPEENHAAQFFTRLTYDEAIVNNLAVMDLAAFNICKESCTPICVYNLLKYPLSNVVTGKDIGTIIASGR